MTLLDMSDDSASYSGRDQGRDIVESVPIQAAPGYINIFSFDELCTPLRDEMLNYAKKLSADPSAADDVVQDAYVRAFLAWPTWNPDGADARHYARAWLYRIVMNTYIKRYHAAVYRRDACHGHDEDIERELHSHDQGEPDAIARDGYCDEITNAIRDLSDEHREIVELHYVRGMTLKAIEAHLSLPRGTICSRLGRALVIMAKVLAPHGSDLGLKQNHTPRLVTDARVALERGDLTKKQRETFEKVLTALDKVEDKSPVKRRRSRAA